MDLYDVMLKNLMEQGQVVMKKYLEIGSIMNDEADAGSFSCGEPTLKLKCRSKVDIQAGEVA